MISGDGANSIGLSRRYQTALHRHLVQGPRSSLRPAGLLGRQALAAGLGTLEVAKIHQQVLKRLAPLKTSARNGDGIAGHAAAFLVEAIKPIEKARRAASNKERSSDPRSHPVRRRATALEAALQRARLEIRQRRAAQEALKKSERHYGLLLTKSRHMQEHLRRLSHELLSAQEEERLKISRELHDEIGQTLTAVNVRLATLKKEATVNTAGLKRKIASTQRLVERSMNTVHRFARELRPPLLDDMGLIPALHSYMRAFTKRTGVPIHFSTYALVEQLDNNKRTVLYRVAQEALTNVAKHAEAGLVKVNIRKVGDTVHMDIHDDGKSFQVQRVLYARKIERLGLLGMRERVEMVGGSFAVESAPGKGTTITAQIPLGGKRKSSPGGRRQGTS